MDSKSNTVRKDETKTPGPSTVAPPKAAEGASASKAPRAHKSVLSGPAYARLVTAGAVLITIASKGMLHDKVTSQLISGISAKDLAGTLPGLVKGWDAFDSGYLAGKSASYGICAVITQGKKAKTSPAFLWAVPPATKGADPVLYTALGEPWTQPSGTGRIVDAYASAMGHARGFFNPVK
jgi:hypothetical protein